MLKYLNFIDLLKRLNLLWINVSWCFKLKLDIGHSCQGLLGVSQLRHSFLYLGLGVEIAFLREVYVWSVKFHWLQLSSTLRLVYRCSSNSEAFPINIGCIPSTLYNNSSTSPIIPQISSMDVCSQLYEYIIIRFRPWFTNYWEKLLQLKHLTTCGYMKWLQAWEKVNLFKTRICVASSMNTFYPDFICQVSSLEIKNHWKDSIGKD